MSDYRNEALCRDFDPELWFPTDERPGSPGVEYARSLCALCPVRVDCLAESLARGDAFGVFGGLAPAERAALRRAPTRARSA
jgi:WhiB family redox-sensing transcriptional regulator